MVNRHQQPVGFDQLVEGVLEDVVNVARVGHTRANEGAQPGLFPPDHVGDPVVLLESHPLQACRAFPLRC